MNVESQRALNPNTAKITTFNLKLCPLCDSLNANSNRCCFVCGWQGEFIKDPHKLHTSLVLLLEQCPELYPIGPKEVAKPKLLDQFKLKFCLFLHRVSKRKPKLDIRV